MPRPRSDGAPPAQPKRARLTQQCVDELQPGPRAYQVWDVKLKGFAVRVQPSGQKTWKVTYRYDGAPQWFHVGKVGAIGIEFARALAQKVLERAAGGTDPHALRLLVTHEGRETKKAVQAVRKFEADRRLVVDNGIIVDPEMPRSEGEARPTVYIVKIGSAVKIGFTVYIEKRLRELRGVSAEPMTVLACLDGDRSLEKTLHRFFEDYRIRNEFFEERAVRSFLNSTFRKALVDEGKGTTT